MPSHDDRNSEADRRAEADLIARAVRRETRGRLGPVFLARTLALLAVAALVAAVTPWPESLYFLALIFAFILLGGAQYLIGRSRHARDWHVYAFVALDMALLAFTLIYPNPLASDALPPQATMRFSGFIYLFVVIGAQGMTLRPPVILWGGLCGAIFWSLGIAWLASLPESKMESLAQRKDGPGRDLALMLDPHFIDLGVQLQGVVVLLIVSGLVAFGSEAARRLLARETTAARRAANLSRYLPAEAVETLSARDEPFESEREAEAAVLFTDIVGFSSLAERRGANETIGVLREAHELVANAVFEAGGVLDKFIGDGAMATFGTAQALEDGDPPAARAIAAARAIVGRSEAWNGRRKAEGAPPVRFSLGLHYGAVVIGDVGSARRMELAVIGDAVNVASRLEGMTRDLGVAAAISDEVANAAGRPAGLRLIGERPVRGRVAPVIVWTLA